MKNAEQIRLVLFFTRGISLKQWDNIGMFEREVALYRRLQMRDVRITFVTYGNASDLIYRSQLPGIRILCNRWGLPARVYKYLLPWLYAPQLWGSDVIKTNQTDGADLALRVSRLWRKPLIARCGYMWSEFVTRQQGIDSAAAREACDVETLVFDTAQQVVVTTPMMAADVSRRIPAAAERVKVIPNYVDTELFHPIIDGNHDYEIIFVGRLSPQKNVAALLQAVKDLEIRATLIGDGELLQELQQRFSGLNGQVRWLKKVPNVELPGYLNRAKIFILPSYYEGHPKTLLEAMACGLPVIGADSPGIRELIRHGENGWLCGTDAASIRSAIQELLHRPQLRAELGRNARQFVVENFALERIIEMELALLYEVVG